MKYLVFNAVVFLALGYLVVGGDFNKIVPVAQEDVTSLAIPAQHKEAAKPIVAQKVENVPERVPQMPEKKVVEKVVDPEPVKTAPPPLPPAQEVAKLEPKEAPSRRLQEKAQLVVPVKEVVPAASVETAQPNKLESARERSKELRQMVADMERMFAEKMTR